MFLLYQLLIFLNLFTVYLFRQRDCKKKVSTSGRLKTIFLFHPVSGYKMNNFLRLALASLIMKIKLSSN